MGNVTSISSDAAAARQRLATADLLRKSEEARQKALQYLRCFSDLEKAVATLNGAKRHHFRMQLRALQREFEAAIDDLGGLELQLCEIHQTLSKTSSEAAGRLNAESQAAEHRAVPSQKLA